MSGMPRGRSVTCATVAGSPTRRFAQWKLGFQPDDWDWLQRRANGKYSPQTLEAAKLITKNSKGPGYSDFFRGRVLFPICNERGQTLSFGGRILPGDNDSWGKYRNGFRVGRVSQEPDDVRVTSSPRGNPRYENHCCGRGVHGLHQCASGRADERCRHLWYGVDRHARDHDETIREKDCP